MTADDKLRAAIIERLMCDLALDLDRFGGVAAFASEYVQLKELAAQGLVTLDGDRITLTTAGRPYVRIVASVFDSYLAATQKRHSVAV